MSVCPGGGASGYTYFLPRVRGRSVFTLVFWGLHQWLLVQNRFGRHTSCRGCSTWLRVLCNNATVCIQWLFFFAQEEALESRIVTKGYMEARMVSFLNEFNHG